MAVIYLPILGETFSTVPLQPRAWLECIGLAALSSGCLGAAQAGRVAILWVVILPNKT